MNAPTPREVFARVTEGAYELIPIGAIAPSETNIQKLRRQRYSMDTLADLRDSIRKLGVQQPIVVRKLAALRRLASYEVVFGERRLRAAGQAGLEHIPAIVRVLTDSEVLEVQLVENLQREDLHPLEEAAGYEELMKIGKLKKEELGEKVGKSRSWVYSRLNLLKLPKQAQDALQTGVIDVSRALLVASIADPERQAEVLARALERTHNNNPTYSVRQLRADVLRNRITFPLVGAPFPTDDALLLPLAGACGPCPFRTGNCDPEAADADVCTNVPCYEQKVEAHGDRRRIAVIAKGGKVLKGEAARLVSPSVHTVYGHVDLDLVCDYDEFPEKEPALPKGVDRHSEEADRFPAMIAWTAREEAWQPRTYRALLEGEKYDSVLLDDPKTKLLRELVPFGQAQKLLKKKGITLPSHANRHRPKPVKQSSRASHERAEINYQARQRLENEKREREAKVRAEILKAVFPKVKGTLTRDVLEDTVRNLDGRVDDEVQLLFGHKDLRKLKEVDLARILVARDAIVAAGNTWQPATALLALAAKHKIDVAAIRKRVTTETTKKAGK
jgi:ParB/RepB/Spo0J family partition protein